MHRLMIAIAAAAAATSILAAAPPPADCEAELAKLRRAYEGAHAERAAAATELTRARKRVAELEAEVAALRADKDVASGAHMREEIISACAAHVRACVESLFKSAEKADLADDQMAMLAGLIRGAIRQHIGERPEAGVYLRPAMELAEEWASRGPDRQDKQDERGRRAVRAAEQLLARAPHDPAAAAELIRMLDRRGAAKVAGELSRGPIAWRGTVVQAIDYAVVPWQIIVDCAGLTVRVVIQDRGQIGAGVTIGSDVTVRGRIEAVNSDPEAGVFVVAGATIESWPPPAERRRR